MNFNKKSLLTCMAVLAVATTPAFARGSDSARVVDFSKCYSESSYGKREQESNNQMKEQMEKAIQELNAQLTETSSKLNDEFVRDSLSPEAEKELQDKMQTLSGELQRYQQQYYYMMQQANYKTMNVMAEQIKKAAKLVAEKKGYALVMNKDQVFHYTENLDVTESVITELDSMFKAEATEAAKKEAAKAEKK